MPKIQRYETQATLTTARPTSESPAVQVDSAALSQSSRALSQMGTTIAAIGENIAKVKADQEFAQAKIAGANADAEIKSEAAQDNDFQNFEAKYSKKYKEAQDTILRTIKSSSAKEAFSQDFGLKSTYGFHNIMSSGRKRFIAYDKDLMAQETVQAKDRYYQAQTNGEKQDAKNELSNIFQRRVENNVLNEPEAAVLHRKTVDDLTEGQAEYDIFTNPNLALIELNKGNKGIYKGLPPDKQVGLIKKANTRIKDIEKDAKYIRNENKINNRFDVISNISNGDLNWEESNQIMNNIFRLKK